MIPKRQPIKSGLRTIDRKNCNLSLKIVSIKRKEVVHHAQEIREMMSTEHHAHGTWEMMSTEKTKPRHEILKRAHSSPLHAWPKHVYILLILIYSLLDC